MRPRKLRACFAGCQAHGRDCKYAGKCSSIYCFSFSASCPLLRRARVVSQCTAQLIQRPVDRAILITHFGEQTFFLLMPELFSAFASTELFRLSCYWLAKVGKFCQCYNPRCTLRSVLYAANKFAWINQCTRNGETI